MTENKRTYLHAFATFLWNGESFKEYGVIGHKDREVALARMDLLIDNGGLKMLNKRYTEFNSFRWIDEEN